jgi:L-alanine-DL-glutamate epimerase-like enolase superfamily enzyme
MELIYAHQQWPYRETFRISRGDSVCSDLFVAWVRDGERVGRGECGILTQYGHTSEVLAAGFEAARDLLRRNPRRDEIAAGVENPSVRNALDCALWDLECKQAGRTIWDLTGVPRPASIEVDLTISVNPVAKMCDDAATAVAAGYRVLKLKADGADVLARVSAIAERVSGATFIVDANEAWDIDMLQDLAAPLARLGVVLIEQPLHHQADEALEAYAGPIPICADESCRDRGDLDRLAARYQAINIKLDKVGGLTPALALARAAKARGLGLMLGCSGPTSLGAAPAYVVAALADHVDLDGPALLLEDREARMTYRDGRLHAFDTRLWGG